MSELVKGRKVIIIHHKFDVINNTEKSIFLGRVKKAFSADPNKDDEFRMQEFGAWFDQSINFIGENLLGVTVVIDREAHFIVAAVCRKPDQFSKRYGRLLALNRLADKIIRCEGLKRTKRVFKNGNLYFTPKGQNVELDNYPDIREELKWASGEW